MRRKIQKSMLLILSGALLISYLLLTVVVYQQTLNIMEGELAQEAEYIKAAVEISGKYYLEDMDNVRKDTRVTLIAENGNVLYDSGDDAQTLENHASRREVEQAAAFGSGKDVRLSDTVGKEMFYYAIKMKDSSILRVSKTMDTVWRTALNVLPYMIGIGLIMGILSWILARHQVARLIRPINTLDLEKPLENDVYEELSPLLERIDRQNKEKDKIEQMRREFSANVSHELKTPLTSISGYAEIMMNGLVRPEDMQGFSERIYHEASRMITLVGDIIKLSKLDEGSIELEKEEVDLYALAREVVSRLAPQAEKKKVRIEVSGEHVTFRGIRQIVDEMIYNICENAIKYNVEGGTVSIWAGNTLRGRLVSVRDTGIGIPEEHQERIFERFYRVDKSHSRDTGGTGLGLSIVKHGALLHEVDIQVESKVGVGTKMELNFH
ncbi:ATP-binding protein [Bariatricus massiliensis]|uniref:histidine kinase n=1 Tax=Bariatricus massiliensis TaxID=1745713 RepID=A0ABS8DDK6_9FIRM|nr:ATP-binding protein [Bariatricus massiliensis]MCB7302611.1 two-component sensor histidine kinase [Bariatricus massiliensis]MCB7373827.1 two-component sensor histidine kinase [Bariatricus massiliensis]MCB7386497.1 two-component sensor histidine kinase [Bariatricus massiliensis]MCB7410659.1 two-component sensor histidine kinase [Bariatricus massiliensis]MCQ5253503.1 ATP-binding protein [Bariatricus massiliensis]